MNVNEAFDADGALIERVVDNGDGTGTRTTYLPDGTVDTVEQLTGLPVPPLPTDDLLTAVDPRDTTTIRRT